MITKSVMTRIAILAVLVSALQFHTSPTSLAFSKTSTSDSAEALVRSALAKMGGEERLRAINTVEITGIGHTYFIEQSERPEGPWLADYRQITEWRDYGRQRLRRRTQNRNILETAWTTTTLIVADGLAATPAGERMIPGQASQVAEAEETLALSPERVLLTALNTKDLHLERDTMLQGVAQHQVGFSWRDVSVRVYLSSQTEMPTAIEYVRAYPDNIFWGVWGDVTTRIYLSLWSLEPGGLRYPRQWNVERNGTPYQEFTVTSLTLNLGLDEGSFSIGDDVRKAYEARSRRIIDDLPLGRADRPPVEMAPGVVQVPGSWNVALVRQPEGVVIIEAPISSGYSGKVIADAQKRFPGLPIKALISSSDAWPHIGGIREYVARDIPIYALDLNRPILERLIRSPHRANPDALERAPRKARFNIVSTRTVIGSGPNRIEIYPVRTETGERMLMVYLPEHKLLYGSDLVQRMPDGSFFMPEYLVELKEAVQRERLAVDRVFTMHMVVAPWSDIEAAIAKAKAPVVGSH